MLEGILSALEQPHYVITAFVDRSLVRFAPGGAVRVRTEDVQAFGDELREKDYKYAKPGVDETPWHTREAKLTDPFGNRLIFFEEMST